MPMFDYRCESCEKTVEVLQKLSDPPKTACRECGSEMVRLMGAPSFTLKGTGWYKPGHSG